MEAARKVFTQKGYAATRTRDIAEEAGINLALLNYYYRSKQKLFDKVMMEKIHQLFGAIAPILNDREAALETKIERIVSTYIDMLSKNPDLPLFVLSEIKNNPGRFAQDMQVKDLILQCHLVKQLHERKPEINPLHFVISLLGMTIFPFVARPVFQAADAVDGNAFKHLLEERKQLIPIWMTAMLEAS